MRIAIINPTGGGMSGGYRNYLRNILPRLAEHPDVEELFCITPPSVKLIDWVPYSRNITFADCRPYGLASMFSVDRHLKSSLEGFAPDVVFIPMERYVSFNRVPKVNMVRNMAPLKSLHQYSSKERLRHLVQRSVSRVAAKKANRVIAVSKFVRDHLVERWSLPTSKISIIHHGVTLPSVKHERPVAIPMGWEGEFLFAAGAIEPYRGLEDIIGVIKRCRDQCSDLKVVIAGGARLEMVAYLQRLQDIVEANGLSSNVCFLGEVTEDVMSWCYSHCAIFLMTSRIEACPNTALEAMAHGCLCIAANNPPLPEIFGDAVIYYHPGDEGFLLGAIQQALHWDQKERNERMKRMKMRASQFNWDTTVDMTIAALRKAIDGAG
jgi:glycosyltransferase involved in cell wall biosynthesis